MDPKDHLLTSFTSNNMPPNIPSKRDVSSSPTAAQGALRRVNLRNPIGTAFSTACQNNWEAWHDRV